jgi:hypothetical protein
MSGVNGADQTPFKSGGVAVWGLSEEVRPAHAIRKGKTRYTGMAQTMEARKRFLILALCSCLGCGLYLEPAGILMAVAR